MSVAASGSLTIGGDLEVHRLGYGAMRIVGPGVWGPPPDRDVVLDVLRRVVSLGVNLIDTADSYGPHFSEQLIHDALYPYPEGLVIATKGGLTRSGPGEWARNGRPEHLREACERSLRDLRVERIDLYQLHAPDPDVPYEESVGALAELQSDGLIRHIGVSNVSLDQLEEARSIVEVVTVRTASTSPTGPHRMCSMSASATAWASSRGSRLAPARCRSPAASSTRSRGRTMRPRARSRSPGCLRARR